MFTSEMIILASEIIMFASEIVMHGSEMAMFTSEIVMFPKQISTILAQRDFCLCFTFPVAPLVGGGGFSINIPLHWSVYLGLMRRL